MIVLAVAHGILLFSLAWMVRRQASLTLQRYYLPACLAKVGAGIGLGLLYRYYYTTGDTYMYFHDAGSLARLAVNHPADYVRFLWSGDASFSLWHQLNFQEPRALFLVKVASVFSLATDGNYWLMSAYCSLLSFLAAWYLFRSIALLFPAATWAAAMALLFFPSVVWWTSGLIKESFAMAALYFLMAIVFKLWYRQPLRVWHYAFAPLALWMLWNLKYYYLAVFLPVAITGLVVQRVVIAGRQPTRYAVVAWWSLIFLVPLVVVSFVHPNFYPERFLTVIVDNYQTFAQLSAPGDYAVYPHLQPTASSMLRYLPQALWAGLFRPWLGEASGVMQGISAIENTVLLLLVITAWPAWRRTWPQADRLMVLSLVLYAVVLGVFLALSTPNFGTLSRYRVGFLPVVVGLATYQHPWANRLRLFLQRTF